MGRAHDPIAATRALICQFDVTDDGVVLFNGRRAILNDVKVLKDATATLEELLQDVVDTQALLPKSPAPATRQRSRKSGTNR